MGATLWSPETAGSTSIRAGRPTSRWSGGACTGPGSTSALRTPAGLRLRWLLYSYVHAAEPSMMRNAARWRVRAMDVSDRWVAAVCVRDDPLLREQRWSLVASYAALSDAAERVEHSTGRDYLP